MLIASSDSYKYATINPPDTHKSTLHAVSIDESDVNLAYYAIGIKDGSNNWSFHVVSVDWGDVSAEIKKVTADISRLEVSDIDHINGGM